MRASARDVIRVAEKKGLDFWVEKKPIKYKRVGSLADVGPRTFFVAPSDAEHTKAVKSETHIAGRTETRDLVYPGNVVMGGPQGERYVVRTPRFFDLYDTSGDVAIARTGRPRRAVRVNKELLEAVVGVSSSSSEGFEFDAPWGESMIANSGDVLILESDRGMYRVEKRAFAATYRRRRSGKISRTELYTPTTLKRA